MIDVLSNRVKNFISDMKNLMVFLVAGLLVVVFRVQADEGKISQVDTALGNTTISGYVDVAATFNSGSEIQFAPAISATYDFSSGIQPAPEPSSFALLTLGFVSIGFIIIIRRKQVS